MDSFIRSKYESRRWALDGPPPSDPATLEGNSIASGADSKPSPSALPGSTSVRTDLPHRQPSAPAVTPAVTTRLSQPHQLLSAQYARGQVTPQPTTPAASPTPPSASAPSTPAPENDLFSLDFHAPPANPTPTTPAPKKDTKQDILSLFSAPAAPSPWAQAPVTQQQSQTLPPFSNTTTTPSSATTWNIGHNWNNPVPPVQQNAWGSAAPAQQPSLLDSGSDIWGGSVNNSASASVGVLGSSTATGNTHADKKEDVFGDIWGSFK
jgi:stromal membrane-associated protein